MDGSVVYSNMPGKPLVDAMLDIAACEGAP